jgi:hypothetical protein
MFTAKDLTVGDLVATLSGTVVSISDLPAKINGIQLMAITVLDWNDNTEHSYNARANNEYEVWE